MRSHSSVGASTIGPEQHHAGVVDDRVQPAELAHGLGHEADRLLLIGHVALDHERAAAGLADLVGQRVQAVLAPRGDRHRRPLRRELARGRLADAAARARDQRDGPMQSFAHGEGG